MKEESCVLVNSANKGLYHRGGVAAALSETAGPRFQAESDKILQQRKSPNKTRRGDSARIRWTKRKAGNTCYRA